MIVPSVLLSLCGLLAAAPEGRGQADGRKEQDPVILKLKIGDEEPAAAEEAPRADWKEAGTAKATKKQDGAVVMVQGFERKEIDTALDCPREFSLPALKEVDEKTSLRLLDESRERAKAASEKAASVPFEKRVEKAAKAAKKAQPESSKKAAKGAAQEQPVDSVIRNLTY